MPDQEVRGDELEVTVAGEVFTHWEEVEVLRALGAASGSFRLATVPDVRQRWPVRPLDPVTIELGGERLLTGHVDSLEASVEGSRTRVTVRGRDKTADLVDCSARPIEYRGLSAFEIAERVAEPFGMELRREVDSLRLGEPFEVFAVQPAETAWSAIDRVARMRALLVETDGFGRLVFTRPGLGISEAAVVEGENLESATLNWTFLDRFSIYIVDGQRSGSDDGWGSAIAAIRGVARDGEIDRFRPLGLLAEETVTFSDAADRAQWELANRRARSLQLECVVPGWRQTLFGAAWKPNLLVPIEIASLSLSREWLTRSVLFRRGPDQAAFSTLLLVLPDSFDPRPELESGTSRLEEFLEGAEFEEDF